MGVSQFRVRGGHGLLAVDVRAIAEEHGKSVAQVVLRWLIQREVVVIPKSVRPGRMAQNLDVFDFTLTGEQMSR